MPDANGRDYINASFIDVRTYVYMHKINSVYIYYTKYQRSVGFRLQGLRAKSHRQCMIGQHESIKYIIILIASHCSSVGLMPYYVYTSS